MSNIALLIAEWIFYGAHLIIFTLYLLCPIGDQIARKCLNNWFCSRHWHHRESYFQVKMLMILYHYSTMVMVYFSTLQFFVFQYNVDLADHQWKEFRGGLPLLFITATATSIISWIILQSSNRLNLKHIQSFRLIFGMFFVIVQHGLHSLIIFGICIGGLLISLCCRRKFLHPFITWIYAIFVLLVKESYRIQHWDGFHFLRILFDRDFAGGLYSWRLPTNFLVLRIISYNIDVYWAHLDIVNDGNSDRGTNTNLSLSGKKSEDTGDGKSLPIGEYDSLVNYFAYILYAPLYIAGPIVTYKAFLMKDTSSDSVVVYFLRWLLCLAVMEYLTHRFPLFSVMSSGLLPRLTVAETAVLFYLILKIMWLKFLLIWRFFRLWAMVDGVDVPENMQRCMSNNYSLGQFWFESIFTFHSHSLSRSVISMNRILYIKIKTFT